VTGRSAGLSPAKYPSLGGGCHRKSGENTSGVMWRLERACRNPSRVRLVVETMRECHDSREADGPQTSLPDMLNIKAPVTRELLEADTEFDPEGAERFVEIIRRLRSRSVPVGKT
jgi:hypothetical protein